MLIEINKCFSMLGSPKAGKWKRLGIPYFIAYGGLCADRKELEGGVSPEGTWEGRKGAERAGSHLHLKPRVQRSTPARCVLMERQGGYPWKVSPAKDHTEFLTNNPLGLQRV